MGAVFRTGQIELRLGDWRDVLHGLPGPGTVITDPPYSEETHHGHNAGSDQTRSVTGQRTRQEVAYDYLTKVDVYDLVASWACTALGWACYMTDDWLAPTYRDTARSCARYDFAPVPVIQKRPRLLGDGPSSWAVYLMVSRPRTIEFSRWGCLPGMYQAPTVSVPGIAGGKPVSLMRQIVRDYTRPGDLVIDPFAGSGSTLQAAAAEGRRAIGCERDPETFEIAVERLREGPLMERMQPRQMEIVPDAT